MKRWILSSALVVATLPAFAAEVAGVKLDDKVAVAGSELSLNGAGVRTKFGLAKVYVAGLYLSAKSRDADAIIGAKQTRRVTLVMKRDVEAEKMLDAFKEGITANTSGAELAAIQPKIAEMEKIFKAVREVRENDVIHLDFNADGSTRITVRNQPKDVIQGMDFQAAMLRIWLGKKPVQDDLKKSMLEG
ncbi:chalcone isomerase family protein [Chitinivorax sp. B]|uniref:chalcone isomerase family protein n=1 Tax=Chitinivorax sp. B TaxID=2502235 RepID=UPI0010F9B339|nr:chalcone isomerase family protein [Chitinivorax sp. B]